LKHVACYQSQSLAPGRFLAREADRRQGYKPQRELPSKLNAFNSVLIVRSLSETVGAADWAKEEFQALGGELLSFYLKFLHSALLMRSVSVTIDRSAQSRVA